MVLEIRPVKKEEMEAFCHSVRTAFAAPPEFKLDIPVDWTLCAFENGKLASSYMAWPLTMKFGGNSIPVAGVSMVGTLPVRRRRGYLRQITEKHFNLLHERGERPISALFASMAAIYQRYGYGIVSSRNSYKVEPRYLQFSEPLDITGQFHEADDKEMGQILDMYHRFAEERTGYLQRNEAMEVAQGAPMTVLKFPPTPIPPYKVIYMEDSEPQGYIIYSIERGAGPAVGQRIDIRDLVWLTPQAYHAIWEYFANMDLVDEIIWGRVPPNDPLPHLLLEPRKLNITSGDGLLARIVDVDRALPMRPYREEAVLTFEVIDDFCPWNSGKWKLETSVNGAGVSRTEDEPQLTLPASTLVMLMFGQISASEAARMARLDAHEKDALDVWDKVMRTQYRPFCADMF